MKSFVIFFFLCFFCSFVFASTYWISVDGNSTWANCKGENDLNGPSACPLNLSKNALPGDTVYIRGGNYLGGYIQPAKSGEINNKITFSAYNKEEVVFYDCNSLIVDAGGIMLMYGKNYIIVDGITVRNCVRSLLIRNSHYNEIRNCKFEGARPHPSTGNIGMNWIYDSSTHNWIHHSEFFGRGEVPVSASSSSGCEDAGHSLMIGTETLPVNDYSSNNLIEDNNIYQGGHDAMEVYGPKNIIRNNYFHNEGWIDCSHCTGIPKPGLCGNRNIEMGIYADHTLIEYNRIAFAGIPPDNSSQGAGIEICTSNNIIRFNKIYANSGPGIMPYTKGTLANNNYIYNNTLFHNTFNEYDSLFKGGIRFVSGTKNVAKNNVLFDNYGGEIQYHSSDARDQIVLNNWDGDLQGSPLFINATLPVSPFDTSLPDLRLQQNSPAINSGIWLTKITSESGSGTTIVVEDSNYFFDGFEMVDGDEIMLEDSSHKAKITSINYLTNTITLDKSIIWQKGMGVSLAYEGTMPDMGAEESIQSCSTSNECPSKECYSKSCSQNKCVYFVDESQNGASCTDPDNYECTTNFVCNKGVCVGEKNNSICLSSLPSCSSAICDPSLFPVNGCGNYLPNDCTLKKGLILEYKCENNILDSSSNQNNGACASPRCPSFVEGKMGQGCFFNGDGYIEPSWKSSTQLNDFTISGWLKLNSNAVNEPNGNNTFWQKNSSNRIYAKTTLFSGTLNGKNFSGTNPNTNWVLFTVKREGETLKFFIDSKLTQTQIIGAEIIDFNASTIADKGNYYHMNGIIDEFKIYDRGLTETEIDILYKQAPAPAQNPICSQKQVGVVYDLDYVASSVQNWFSNSITLQELVKRANIWKKCN